MAHSIGDGPIVAHLRGVMNDIARIVDRRLNGKVRREQRTVGFVLLVFPFNEHEGRCNYISNASRDDIVVLLKEQLRRFEGQPETQGRA
ncbi:MAG TPA: hypothetical protein PK857_00420 [Hyphomicrobium sp.]|nr:hypothetical protein [Hyphomicrobium sp.]HRO48796.1 hypothetical protein [Hyphomicrobium sp.]